MNKGVCGRSWRLWADGSRATSFARLTGDEADVGAASVGVQKRGWLSDNILRWLVWHMIFVAFVELLSGS
ncbi:hypothetical protein RYX36_004189 [Vicia faba]